MSIRFQRALLLAIALVSLGEVLLVHWASLALGGPGLSPWQWAAVFAGFGAANALLFPQARKRIHATGIGLLFSRAWILGSIAALFTGLLLAVVLVVAEGSDWLFGAGGAGRATGIWLGGAVVALGFGSVLWGASVGSRRVRVDRVTLPLRHLAPQLHSLQVAHVTDLHIGPLLRLPRLREFVARINDLEPDLIAVTGDIFDFDPAYVEDGCGELAALRARHGVFAVLGNHDVYTGAEIVADGLLRFTGIHLLRNDWKQIGETGAKLTVAGIEDPGHGWTERSCESPELTRLAREIPGDAPCLLLAHRPSYFAHAARLGFPLILAGHTHGGQVALPLAHHHNASRLISRWTRGTFVDGASTLYVNRGLGMAGLPLRINCPREIALIRLAETPA
jgi:predicted MPP superfamily phosphohydrolase